MAQAAKDCGEAGLIAQYCRLVHGLKTADPSVSCLACSGKTTAAGGTPAAGVGRRVQAVAASNQTLLRALHRLKAAGSRGAACAALSQPVLLGPPAGCVSGSLLRGQHGVGRWMAWQSLQRCAAHLGGGRCACCRLDHCPRLCGTLCLCWCSAVQLIVPSSLQAGNKAWHEKFKKLGCALAHRFAQQRLTCMLCAGPASGAAAPHCGHLAVPPAAGQHLLGGAAAQRVPVQCTCFISVLLPQSFLQPVPATCSLRWCSTARTAFFLAAAGGAGGGGGGCGGGRSPRAAGGDGWVAGGWRSIARESGKACALACTCCCTALGQGNPNLTRLRWCLLGHALHT